MIALCRNLRIALVTAVAFFPNVGHAHGDAEVPLFVAENGTDRGTCIDAANPCATLGYALDLAGKGGQILVAAGTYEIASAEDIFHLISSVVQVTGGHVDFTARGRSTDGVSLLTGVPYEYRELLADRGFQIVADVKQVDHDKASAAAQLLGIYQKLKTSFSASPCVAGSAAGLPCENVDLLSHIGFAAVSAVPSAGNDVWGFVDLNTNREYAIVGFNLGTGVFDVTDAENPREVGFIDGQNSTWRDIKVYQTYDSGAERWNAYAYVTTDGSTDGLFVIDLRELPQRIRRLNYASDITRAHNIYAANTDYSTGLALSNVAPALVIAGSSIGNGRYRSYSVSNPQAPAFVTGGTGSGYMHDASSMIIRDARKDTQCVSAGPVCEVLLDFNENSFEIWDVTDASSPALLSNTPYTDASYVHSGWWSEDRQFVFVHDELDERDASLRTTLRVFSVADLTGPSLAGVWSGPTNAIDHNGFVRGNRYYMSNYSRGLTVLDISDPAAPAAVGRLDTYPQTDSSMFVGAWGAYPFFWSGNIAISDMDSGLYMAADRSRDVPEGKLEFSKASFAVAEGQTAALTVRRTGGSAGAVGASFEVVNASTTDGDYSLATGTLSWADGNAGNRTISINAATDVSIESLERLVVRLVSPSGGATLGDLNTANLYISEVAAGSSVSFFTSAESVTERGYGVVVAIVQRMGSAIGAASVDVVVSGSATGGNDYQSANPTTISWADGDGSPKNLEFQLVDDGVVEGDETIELSIMNPTGAALGPIASFTATIVDGNGPNVAPNAIAGGSQTRAAGSLVTLNGSQSSDANGDGLSYQWAQTGGQTVNLNNANTAIANFTAPAVTSDSLLQFELTVADPGGLTDTASTTITVVASTPAPSGGSGGGSPGLPGLLLLAAAVLRRWFIRTDVLERSSARDPDRSK